MPKRFFLRARRSLADPRLRLTALLAALTGAAQLLLPGDPEPGARSIAASHLPGPLYASAVPAVREALAAGETISDVWERLGRPRGEMAEVVTAANGAFNVRQLRSGTPIELFVSPPTALGAGPAGIPLRWPAAVLDSVRIRVDADRTLAVHAAVAGSTRFRAQLREVPVRLVARTYVGCVEGSLYAALERDGEDFTALALDLDRIYGGVVDFYSDLHAGDCVTLHFETFVRPDGSQRLGRIHAAELVTGGQRHAAVWFEAPDGTSDYYDAEGRSLRRQFLRSPLKFTRISSGFTMRRFHPVLKRFRAHPAIDYVAPAGTPVQAAGNGIVAFAGWNGGYGKLVRVRHGKVYETYYAHLSRIAPGIRQGARVSQGQVIGYVGSTGLATAAHLDYRFRKNGVFVNPLDESLPVGEPVASEYVTLFAERREGAMRVLEESYRTALVDGPDLTPEPGLPLLVSQGRAADAVASGFGDD